MSSGAAIGVVEECERLVALPICQALAEILASRLRSPGGCYHRLQVHSHKGFTQRALAARNVRPLIRVHNVTRLSRKHSSKNAKS